MNVDILYEDEAMLVCSKRAGTAVQSRRLGAPDLEGLVRKYLRSRTKEQAPYAAAVHRLDQPVEGLVVFARKKQAAADLSRQFAKHETEKYYLAVTEGLWEPANALLTDYLTKDAKGNRSAISDKNDKNAKRAQLEYRVIETRENVQLLEVHLLTGRHHQIRVQAAHAGHPIVEDSKYNPRYEKSPLGCQLALCAYKLTLTHPVTGKRMTFSDKPKGRNFQDFTYIKQL